ncbi:MAG: hypothetical protein L0Z55_12920 [Planctomycetes bacterium]|nr:hypothetical protein [Planctomycetota bacterium]
MNRREKRLLLVTVAVVGAGLLSWAMRGNDSAGLVMGGAAAAAGAPGAGSNGTETSTQAAGAAAAPAPGAPAGAPGGLPPRAYRYKKEALERVLAMSTELPKVAIEGDPFALQSGGTPEPARARARTGARKLPPRPVALGGIYYSGAVRGALLDGKVIFEGEKLDTKLRLVAVREAEVCIEMNGKEYVLPFEPYGEQRQVLPPAAGGGDR